MFTGLVEGFGTVRAVRPSSKGKVWRIETPFADLALGDSVAVDGVCLTAAELSPVSAAERTRASAASANGAIADGTAANQCGPQCFVAEASAETLAATNLGELRLGQRVHLERALRADTRLGGHLVSGHVDGIGTLLSLKSMGEAQEMRVGVPKNLIPFLAPKGSITVQGVSLTVNRVDGAGFSVALVPYTLEKTTFATLRSGAKVNLEVDLLAKYVASLLGKPGVDGRRSG